MPFLPVNKNLITPYILKYWHCCVYDKVLFIRFHNDFYAGSHHFQCQHVSNSTHTPHKHTWCLSVVIVWSHFLVWWATTWKVDGYIYIYIKNLKNEVQYYDLNVNSSDLVPFTLLGWQLFVFPYIINVGKVVKVLMFICWVLDTGNIERVERLIGQVWDGQKRVKVVRGDVPSTVS